MQNRVQGFGVKGLLETIMKVSKRISLLPWVFLQRSRKRRLLLQGWEPIRTIIKVGQNEWLPPLGGWQMLRKWRKPRRAAGMPCSPPGSRAGAGSSSKTPFYQPALQPGARAQSCRAVWMACHTPTWDKHALSAPCVFRFSCSARADGGRNTCRKVPPTPQETLPCEPAACTPECGVVWALSSTMSAVYSDSLILSHCQESPGAGLRPGNLQAPAGSQPAGQELAVPFPLQEASLHPLQLGEVPTEGI